MWTIRITLLVALAALVGAIGYLIKHRKRYETLLENGLLNYALVIVFNVLSWLVVVLPPAGGWDSRPDSMEYPITRIGFGVMGPVLIFTGIVLFAVTLRQRKVLGAQDVKEGLITTGAYRYFRHPIYAGILSVCLGLGLWTRNVEGLLVFPVLLAIIVVQSLIEERHDMGVRFREPYKAYKQTTRMFGPIWLWSVVSGVNLLLVGVILLVLITSGCSTTPKLTAENRKKDIQFLAQWAKDCNPFVELNEKVKGCPSYQALLPQYLEFAEQAQSNEEFFEVVRCYFNVIGASGHYYLLSEDMLKALKLGSLFGIIKLGNIKVQQYDQAVYWARLSHNISTRAHPPFHIVHREGKYFTDDDWQHNGTTIPHGSEILKVNGMTCSAYLEYIKENTSLRYDAYPKDWTEQYLLIIDEGPDHKGWRVDFLLPDGSTRRVFAPKIKGLPAPKEDRVHTVQPKANCTCLELTEDVGYIRVKGFMTSPLDYVFRGFIKKDRDKIKRFLDRSEGKYRKLIIDIRNNGGGLPQYGYDALIRPFLKKSVTYNQIAGIKRKYLTETDRTLLRLLRTDCSTKKQHVVNVEEVKDPAGFDSNEWIFYEITRRIEPSNPYHFDGSLYVLINGGAVSAADDYANAVKRIGFAKLVGQNTAGGAAGYIGPPVLRLPASGMIFRVETELVINPDGSVNELFGTPPDIRLPPADPPKSITKEDLLKDEWIKKIVTEL